MGGEGRSFTNSFVSRRSNSVRAIVLDLAELSRVSASRARAIRYQSVPACRRRRWRARSARLSNIMELCTGVGRRRVTALDRQRRTAFRVPWTTKQGPHLHIGCRRRRRGVSLGKQ